MKRTKQVAAMLAAMAAIIGTASAGRALSTDDRPASILVWPKIQVDSSGTLTGTGIRQDTLIKLANTNPTAMVRAHCFYVNATSHCSNNRALACETAADCAIEGVTGSCDPSWNETDFDIFLTRDQPLAWYASSGLGRGDFPLEGPFNCNAPLQNIQCAGTTDPICGEAGCNVGQSNLGGGIPPVGEDPFVGSLTCIQYTTGSPGTPSQTGLCVGGTAPVGTTCAVNATCGTGGICQFGTLIGNAEFLQGGPDIPVDAAEYNAIGLAATGTGNTDGTLTIGPGQDYASCPTTLILNHIFDGASDPLGTAANQTYTTDLTLVPCSNDFSTQTPGRVTAQFIVINEFEQRFSSSRVVDCFLETNLSLIDTRNPGRSIFSAGVAGSIAGQTRIHGVGGNTISDPSGTLRCVGGTTGALLGNGAPCTLNSQCTSGVCAARIQTNGGLLGVARASIANKPGGPSWAAYNLHQQGNPTTGLDVIVVP